jgi:HAD superfamily hydrolase (TIGR01450 family)
VEVVTGPDRTQRDRHAIIRRMGGAGGALQSCDRPLVSRYDVALLDLDGVVYLGRTVVPGAAESLAAARAAGMRLAFVTNNAARPPEAVAALLTELGVAAEVSEIVTSAQAAAHYLAARLPERSRVLVIGTTGLIEALRERGLEPVERDTPDVAAVVQGYSPELTWRQLAEGMLAISRGVPWVATNLDRTVPSPRGQLPGNGSLVAALRYATGVEPVSTGKPDPTMHRECVERTGARDPLVVGDRLDTDIEGANAAGCASLLVLTGVTSAATLLSAGPKLRPTYVAADLRGLLTTHPAPELTEAGASCGRWQVQAPGAGGRGGSDGGLLLLAAPAGGASRPAAGDADVDALRALCAAAWREDGVRAWRVSAGDPEAAEALARLGLPGASA